jgi:hypothetical protein
MQDGFWNVITVPSNSERDKHYEVLIMDAANSDDIICECPSYLYRGHCRHQVEAVNKLCLWVASMGPEEQTKEQYKNEICPRCVGPTEWVME